jgi:hypothetical protein
VDWWYNESDLLFIRQLKTVTAMRLVFVLGMFIGLTACTDNEWRAGEWNDMEKMCRDSAFCSAPCQGGQSSAQSGCVEGE